ncbi:STAS domain-containing protein [Gillisia mitskevichiae]|uniref:STAS domain-containing protein n=1 Tax=Gillisia mitskevichiae TaxID=270921 RepID=A0A495P7J6_9FLAO|nr:STAS domain-containing protein [Gillisia mitskevichiae]RKS45182.1 STAS domain-containing protein [Gillisia mitskevichiae]
MQDTILKEDKLVVVTGKLISENVSEVQENLDKALYQTTKLILDISELKKLDVIGVYMLLILKKKAEMFGKQIVILNKDNEIVSEAVINSGLKNIIDVI